METLEREVLSVGYEGQTLDSFISIVQERGVEVLFDVRLNAISRKRGFSKTALSTALRAVGVEYVHLPELGNPKTNRDGYRHGMTSAGIPARDHFRSLLTSAAAVSALDRIATERRLSAVFCFEASRHHCHRDQILDAVAMRRM